MQRFLENNSAYAFQFPEEFSDDPHCQTQERVTGSVSDTLIDHCDKAVYTLPTKSRYAVFDEVDLDLLKTLFVNLSPFQSRQLFLVKSFRNFFIYPSMVKVWDTLLQDKIHHRHAFCWQNGMLICMGHLQLAYLNLKIL